MEDCGLDDEFKVLPKPPLLRRLNTRPPRLSPPQAGDGGQVEQQNKKPQNHEVITSIRLRRILRFEEFFKGEFLISQSENF